MIKNTKQPFIDTVEVVVGTDKKTPLSNNGISYKIQESHRYKNHFLIADFHDICLIKVTEDIKFIPHFVQPAKLPPSDYSIDEGTAISVLGWGMTKVTTGVFWILIVII